MRSSQYDRALGELVAIARTITETHRYQRHGAPLRAYEIDDLFGPLRDVLRDIDRLSPDAADEEKRIEVTGVSKEPTPVMKNERDAADPSATPTIECHGLDTPERVRFYEHDFYPLSNFSAFSLRWRERDFPTSEHAYHWEKFATTEYHELREGIRTAPSAHQAFKLAEKYAQWRRADWLDVRVPLMRELLREKVEQHEYVKRKLLATGDRELVEDSWRDDFWGWGPNRDGQNMLGKLWMEIRTEIRGSVQ